MGLELFESEPLNLRKNSLGFPPSCPADILRLSALVCKFKNEVRLEETVNCSQPRKDDHQRSNKLSLFLILG